MIRLILTILFLIPFFILSLPMLFVEWIIGRFSPDIKSKSSLAIVNWAFRVLIFLAGTRVTVKGEENIPTDKAVLYVGNHQSYYDIILTYPRVKGLTGYVAKKEMLRYPILRKWMKYLHCSFLDRSDIKEGLKTILGCIDMVKAGTSIFIFPEGTRNKNDEELLPFHEGSFKIAEKGGVPIVPVTIVNSAEIFENHFPWIKKTSVIIEYGKPIDLSTMDKETKKKIGVYVRDLITKTHSENKRELN